MTMKPETRIKAAEILGRAESIVQEFVKGGPGSGPRPGGGSGSSSAPKNIHEEAHAASRVADKLSRLARVHEGTLRQTAAGFEPHMAAARAHAIAENAHRNAMSVSTSRRQEGMHSDRVRYHERQAEHHNEQAMRIYNKFEDELG